METIKLDLIPGKKMPSLHASQYDDGREHGIDLFENGVAYKLDGTEKLTINERKVDNNICSMDIENTFVGSSHIEFASFLQMCACAGSNFCELRISKGDVDIGTLNFILEVEPDPTADGIESESEIRNLETQIREITEEVIGDDYYTAEQTDEAIATAVESKADTTYVDTELAKKADKNNTYTKTQVDNALNLKADKNNPTFTGAISQYRRSGSTVGNYSVALGYSNVSSGSASIAEGSNTIASANNAHAEGNATEASARFAHAEGRQTVASAEQSHAEGYNTTASGTQSHAEGWGTEAKGSSQHVSGKYNIVDNNNEYAEIIGNGTSSNARSNARTLDWQGNETLAGDLTYNGNKSLTSEISRLDGRIDNLPAPMIFKGTLGVGGTIQTLPTASASNEGWTFKCITAGTYAGLTLKVGDTVTCFNPPNTSVYEWDISGYGDTDTDTWRAIKVNGIEKLGNGISSGAVDFEDTANVKFEFDANGNKIKATLDGIYTADQVDTLLDDKAEADNTYTKEQVDAIIDSILPTDSTGKVASATFTTSYAKPTDITAYVEATQEAGTPTPSSPKAISGWNAITLDVNGNTKAINLGGTYYGGHLTQDRAGHRQFVVDRKLKTIDGSSGVTVASSSYIKSDACDGYINDDDIQPRTGPEYQPDLLCNRLTQAKGNIWSNVGHSDEFCISNRSIHLNISNAALGIVDYTQETTATAKTKIDSFLQNNPVVVEIPITPYVVDLPDDTPIYAVVGNNIVTNDAGDIDVSYKCSIEEYVANHSGGGGAKSLGGVFLGGSNSGSEEEPTEESENTEKTKLDETKVEVKEIGDDSNIKKIGGE